MQIILDAVWVLIGPASLWAIAIIYVPILAPGLNGFEPWIISTIIVVLIFLCLFLILAHIVAAQDASISSYRLFLSPLGDPAQVWPAALNASKELLVALSGPLTQGLLAVLFYFLWNSQINLFISVIAFFMIFFNLGLMAINLIPAFPFDGGRIIRAVIWRMLNRPGSATELAHRLGWGVSAGLFVWSIIPIAQRARLSLETAAATFILFALVVISLAVHNSWKWNWVELKTRFSLLSKAVRLSAVFLFLLPSVAVTVIMIPINDGLEAPGFTALWNPWCTCRQISSFFSW